MNLLLWIHLSGKRGLRYLSIHIALLKMWVHIPQLCEIGQPSEISSSKKYPATSTFRRLECQVSDGSAKALFIGNSSSLDCFFESHLFQEYIPASKWKTIVWPHLSSISTNLKPPPTGYIYGEFNLHSSSISIFKKRNVGPKLKVTLLNFFWPSNTVPESISESQMENLRLWNWKFQMEQGSNPRTSLLEVETCAVLLSNYVLSIFLQLKKQTRGKPSPASLLCVWPRNWSFCSWLDGVWQYVKPIHSALTRNYLKYNSEKPY